MYTDTSTLDDVAFLLRSANRLDVLDAVRDGPRTRHDLRERTDSSRVTVSRILGDLEDRGWVVRTGEGYEATPRGAIVAGELARLFGNVEAADRLGETLDWLPVEAFDFELSRLADATVVRPTDRDLTATVTLMTDHVRGATRVRNVAPGISSEVVAAYLESAADGDSSLETVMFERVFDVVAGDDTLRRQLSEMVASDAIAVRRYDGEEPPVLVTVCDDETVLVCGRSSDGNGPEVVETTDEAVRAWAVDYFERVRTEAEPVEPVTFVE